MENAFQLFLHELAKTLEFTTLSPDSQDVCLLSFNNEQADISFEYDESLVPNTILLSSQITSIPQEIAVDVLEECLIGNSHIAETLSCPPNESLLFLHRRIHPHIESGELKSIINAFLKRINEWRQKVHSLSQKPSAKHRIPIPPSQFTIYPFKA